METWDAIRSRRNVRDYADRPIPDEVLNRILEAGRITPSAGNKQRWDFVVVTEKSTLARLAEVWQGAGHVPRSSATIVLVAPLESDTRQREVIQYDMGQLTMMLMIAAADLGVGTGHSSIQDQELARQILDLPDDTEPMWMVALGYPADGDLQPLTRFNRRPFDEVVHRERW